MLLCHVPALRHSGAVQPSPVSHLRVRLADGLYPPEEIEPSPPAAARVWFRAFARCRRVKPVRRLRRPRCVASLSRPHLFLPLPRLSDACWIAPARASGLAVLFGSVRPVRGAILPLRRLPERLHVNPFRSIAPPARGVPRARSPAVRSRNGPSGCYPSSPEGDGDTRFPRPSSRSCRRGARDRIWVSTGRSAASGPR